MGGQVAHRIAALERPTDAITSVTPRNATSGPLPIPRLRCTLKVDGGTNTSAIKSTKKDRSSWRRLYLVARNDRVPNPNCVPYLGCAQYNFPRSFPSRPSACSNSIGERPYPNLIREQ
jgi:hypothetical protein